MKNKTKLQYLIDFLDEDQSVIDDLILENFNNQDESEFKVNHEMYYVLDFQEVKHILKDQYNEEVKNLEKHILRSNYSKCSAYIDYEAIVSDRVSDFEYDALDGYLLIDNVDGYYIYKED